MHESNEDTIKRLELALNTIKNIADVETDSIAVGRLDEACNAVEAAIVRLSIPIRTEALRKALTI